MHRLDGCQFSGNREPRETLIVGTSAKLRSGDCVSAAEIAATISLDAAPLASMVATIDAIGYFIF
jgi:hypothetical protein